MGDALNARRDAAADAEIPEFGACDPAATYVLRPAGHALIVDDGRIALVRTAVGSLLPGGGVEAGETASDATRRECFEECGWRVAVGRPLGCADELVYSTREAVHFRKRATFYVAHITAREGEGEPDHETRWTTPAQALQQLSYGSHRWALQRLLDARG